MSQAYLSLPGVAGFYASAPDSAALSITGDIDIRCRVALTDWTPTANNRLVTKYVTSGNQRSYDLYVDTTAVLKFLVSSDGTNALPVYTSAGTGLTDGAVKWVRVTRASGTGTVRFYLSDDGTSWTQLGTDVTGTAGAIFDSTAVLELGSFNGGTNSNIAGRFYCAQVLSGIAGTVAFDADFTDKAFGTSFTESSAYAATVSVWPGCYEPTWLPAEALYGNANHYGYEAKKLDAPEPAPKTTYPAATGGTTYPVAR